MLFKAGKLSDFKENVPLTFSLSKSLRIVLIRKKNQIFAVNDTCPHLGGPLGEGELEDHEIVCPWHFWRFDIRTGECTDGGSPSLSCYKAVIEEGEVYVEIPDEDQ